MSAFETLGDVEEVWVGVAFGFLVRDCEGAFEGDGDGALDGERVGAIEGDKLGDAMPA